MAETETPVAEVPDAGRGLAEIGNLRTHTARGTLINSAFQIGLAGLGLVRRVAVAAFLTREEFGIWGIILAVLITLGWLKQVGIADKYVQQSEGDQEAAFQKAFTIELGLSCAYFVVACIALPIYGAAYGHSEIVLPGVVLATSVILTAFESPQWIPYRRMQYARQRTLASVDPVVSLVGTIALGAAGFGYWGLVWGALIGSVAGAVVCVVTCPYRLRLRVDWATVREYVSFSWPLVGLGLSGILIVQGTLLVANHSIGLAGIGAIGLATTIAGFADGVDRIVSQTIYPAVAAVVDRTENLAEIFLKSNRVALLWAMPFAAALALFAHDFIRFVLGDRWEPAAALLAAVGLICGFGQVAFNWSVFMRAMNRTRPLFLASLADVAVFVVVSAPATYKFGMTGYAIGFGTTIAVQIVMRWYFMRQVLGRFNVLRQIARAVAPIVPAAAVVLAIRAVSTGERTSLQALSEFVLFAATATACTYIFERSLINEIVGYVRGRVARAPSGTVAAGA